MVWFRKNFSNHTGDSDIWFEAMVNFLTIEYEGLIEKVSIFSEMI